MARAARDLPPPLEMLCLRALWTLREGSVKEVRTVVAQSRPLAYTTIMTVLERLVRKGKLKRRKAGRAFVYLPEASREAMRRAAIRELVDSLFDGSEDDLIRFLRGQQAGDAASDSQEAVRPDNQPPDHMDTVLL